MQGREICRETQAIQCRADCSGLEAGGGGGVPIAELIRRVGISEQTFYRWKKQYVGLEVDQVRQLKQVEEENTRLKKLVAELTLDKVMLQDVLAKSSRAFAALAGDRVPARQFPGKRATRLSRCSVESRDLLVSQS